METFLPLDANKLTNKDRNDDLASMILLTEKCMAQLKGEHVPMGGKTVINKQRRLCVSYGAT